MKDKWTGSSRTRDREALYWACRSILLRSTLLFGTAFVAFGLFLTPMLLRDNIGSDRFNVDYATTGSINARPWQGPVLPQRAVCDAQDHRLPDC